MNAWEDWKTSKESQPQRLKQYVLPGMQPETAHVVEQLVHGPQNGILLGDLWEKMQPLGVYESFDALRDILSQLRTMDYIRLKTIRNERTDFDSLCSWKFFFQDGSDIESWFVCLTVFMFHEKEASRPVSKVTRL